MLGKIARCKVGEVVLGEVVHNDAGEAIMGEVAYDEIGKAVAINFHARIGTWWKGVGAAF